jgi:hypothetical protein
MPSSTRRIPANIGVVRSRMWLGPQRKTPLAGAAGHIFRIEARTKGMFMKLVHFKQIGGNQLPVAINPEQVTFVAKGHSTEARTAIYFGHERAVTVVGSYEEVCSKLSS